MAGYRVPGLALAVVESNAVVWLKGYGIAGPDGRKVTPQTPFFLGSVSKSFTAMAVMQMMEAGRLDLDAPVKQYIPWFSMKDGPGRSRGADRITLRQLLHHTSGIGQPAGQGALALNEERPDALERQVRSLASVPLAGEPGRAFQYANANYQIAGLAVQLVSGRSVEEVVMEGIFKPLGMAHSHASARAALADGLATGYRWWFGWPVAFPGQPVARGCFPSGFAISCAEDLGRYLIAQLNGGRLGEAVVLAPESVKLTHTAGLNHYGMGWFVREGGVIDHGGQLSCFGAHLYMDMKRQRGIALLVNVNRGEGCGHLYELAPAIARLLVGEKASLPPVDQGGRGSLLQLLGVCAGLGLWIAWSARRLWTWRNGTRPGPRGWRLGFFWTVPLLVESLAVAGLVSLVPVALPVAFLHSPDAMGLWLLAAGGAAGWGVARTLWVGALVARAARPPGRCSAGPAQSGPC